MGRRDADLPIRTCVGCRRRRPQQDLIRCVLNAAGRPAVDRHGPGRGAWLCVPPGPCFEQARRRRAFERAWRRPVSSAVLGELRTLLESTAACDDGLRKVE